MSNVYAQFLRLLPQMPLQVGTVLASSDGSLVLELPGGGLTQARGDAPIGSRVFFRDSVVEGPAPDLPILQIDL